MVIVTERFAILFTPQYFVAGRPDWTLAKQMFLDWATAENVTVSDMSRDFYQRRFRATTSRTFIPIRLGTL
jgi:hypothetical protein